MTWGEIGGVLAIGFLWGCIAVAVAYPQIERWVRARRELQRVARVAPIRTINAIRRDPSPRSRVS